VWSAGCGIGPLVLLDVDAAVGEPVAAGVPSVGIAVDCDAGALPVWWQVLHIASVRPA
jgi:hypothetical protein